MPSSLSRCAKPDGLARVVYNLSLVCSGYNAVIVCNKAIPVVTGRKLLLSVTQNSRPLQFWVAYNPSAAV